MLVVSFDARDARLELAASFGRCREGCLPWRFLRLSRQDSVTTSRDQTAITPGQRGDAPVAIGLLGQVLPSQVLHADAAYDSDALRQVLLARGTTPVIPNNPTRRHHHPFERSLYKRRNVIERSFCRLKDFRRVATRYDRLACTYDATVCLAAIVLGWL